MLSLIPTWLKAALVGVAGAVLALLGGWVAGKREGRSEARTEALQADRDRAKEIEDKADEAREHFVDRHPVDRLRKSGRLRD